MVEQTLVFIKPDGVKRHLIGQIIMRFENLSFKFVHMKLLTITSELADKHYAEHIDKPFYPPLKEFIMSGPVLAFIIEGESVVSITRKLIGETDSSHAAPGTIRGDFSVQTRTNLIHASDCVVSAKREIENFLPYMC